MQTRRGSKRPLEEDAPNDTISQRAKKPSSRRAKDREDDNSYTQSSNNKSATVSSRNQDHDRKTQSDLISTPTTPQHYQRKNSPAPPAPPAPKRQTTTRRRLVGDDTGNVLNTTPSTPSPGQSDSGSLRTRYLSGSMVQVIDLEAEHQNHGREFRPKLGAFPRYNEGDVYIQLAKSEDRYCFALESSVLVRASRAFASLLAITVRESDPQLAEEIVKKTGYKYRLELVHDDSHRPAWLLKRSSLTPRIRFENLGTMASTPGSANSRRIGRSGRQQVLRDTKSSMGYMKADRYLGLDGASEAVNGQSHASDAMSAPGRLSSINPFKFSQFVNGDEHLPKTSWKDVDYVSATPPRAGIVPKTGEVTLTKEQIDQGKVLPDPTNPSGMVKNSIHLDNTPLHTRDALESETAREAIPQPSVIVAPSTMPSLEVNNEKIKSPSSSPEPRIQVKVEEEEGISKEVEVVRAWAHINSNEQLRHSATESNGELIKDEDSEPNIPEVRTYVAEVMLGPEVAPPCEKQEAIKTEVIDMSMRADTPIATQQTLVEGITTTSTSTEVSVKDDNFAVQDRGTQLKARSITKHASTLAPATALLPYIPTQTRESRLADDDKDPWDLDTTQEPIRQASAVNLPKTRAGQVKPSIESQNEVVEDLEMVIEDASTVHSIPEPRYACPTTAPQNAGFVLENLKGLTSKIADPETKDDIEVITSHPVEVLSLPTPNRLLKMTPLSGLKEYETHSAVARLATAPESPIQDEEGVAEKKQDEAQASVLEAITKKNEAPEVLAAEASIFDNRTVILQDTDDVKMHDAPTIMPFEKPINNRLAEGTIHSDDASKRFRDQPTESVQDEIPNTRFLSPAANGIELEPEPLLPTTMTECGIPIEDCVRYENLFLLIQNMPPNIDTTNIHIALEQIEPLLATAERYCCAFSVRAHLSSHLLSFGRELFQAILQDPPRWLDISTQLRCAPIYREAMIHIVGQSPNWPWKTIQRSHLSAKIHNVINSKTTYLSDLKDGINRSLFESAIKVNGHDLTLFNMDESSYSTWLVVQIWRDWFCHGLTSTSKEKRKAGTFYRIMGQGSESYLPPTKVYDTLLKVKSKNFALSDFNELVGDMRLMKDFAKATVRPLVANFSMLDIEEAGIEHLTCTKIENDELPWANRPAN